MQLVIDISEEEYNLIKMKSESNIGGVSSEAEQMIANGTPLPKGHGKLKDADKIVAEIDSAYPNLDRQDIKQWVFNAETIIEADKENKE